MIRTRLKIYALTVLLATTSLPLLHAQELGSALQQGENAFANEQYEDALRLWLPLAKNGNPEAMRNVALLYAKGLGTEKNLEEAVLWRQKAADQGLTEAQVTLGLMYITGEGVEQNPQMAADWFRKAADNNNASGQYNLALLHLNGLGVEYNPKTAEELLRLAGKQGNEKALLMLDRLLNGDVPPPPQTRSGGQATDNNPGNSNTDNSQNIPAAQTRDSQNREKDTELTENPNETPEETRNEQSSQAEKSMADKVQNEPQTEAEAERNVNTLVVPRNRQPAEEMAETQRILEIERRKQEQQALENNQPTLQIVQTSRNTLEAPQRNASPDRGSQRSSPNSEIDVEQTRPGVPPKSPAEPENSQNRSSGNTLRVPDRALEPRRTTHGGTMQNQLDVQRKTDGIPPQAPTQQVAERPAPLELPPGKRSEPYSAQRTFHDTAKQLSVERTQEGQAPSRHIQNTPVTRQLDIAKNPNSPQHQTHRPTSHFQDDKPAGSSTRHGRHPVIIEEQQKIESVLVPQKHAHLIAHKPLMSKAITAYDSGHYRKAYMIWQQAAKTKDPDALLWLGRLYNRGEGVPIDRFKAYGYMQLAADCGSKEAKTAIANLMSRMSYRDRDRAAQTYLQMGQAYQW